MSPEATEEELERAENYTTHLDSSIAATGEAWVTPLAPERGIKWKNGSWYLRMRDRIDHNAEVRDCLDETLSLCIRAIRNGELRAFLRSLEAPIFVIRDLMETAFAYIEAVRLTQQSIAV